PPAQEFAFAYPAEYSSAAVHGKATKHIDIYMSPSAQPEWKWSASKGKWLRYERDAKHVMLDGTQLYADNVIILRVQVKYTTKVKRGLAVPETLVSGKSGSGFIATD